MVAHARITSMTSRDCWGRASLAAGLSPLHDDFCEAGMGTGNGGCPHSWPRFDCLLRIRILTSVQRNRASRFGFRLGRVLAAVLVGALLLGTGVRALHVHEDSSSHSPCLTCAVGGQSAVFTTAPALARVEAVVECLGVADPTTSGFELASPVAARGPPRSGSPLVS